MSSFPVIIGGFYSLGPASGWAWAYLVRIPIRLQRLQTAPRGSSIALLIVLFQQKSEVATRKVAIQTRLVGLNCDPFFQVGSVANPPPVGDER
ncbi:hypothetical protein ALP35_200085 [Pseudomonas savastanoi pv. glycinea]|nr:hypothetical protein ALP35_200085 [Pseudomonas savastanoi pv. glycinea]